MIETLMTGLATLLVLAVVVMIFLICTKMVQQLDLFLYGDSNDPFPTTKETHGKEK